MSSEFRKSINSILFERVSSPLYGTFFFSWLIWNWEILYLTFFISENSLNCEGCTKIGYIQDNYLDLYNILWYPIVSTIVLILIVPFISNGAYWISLQFRQWRLNQKTTIEGKQRLTLERSIEIMKEINKKDREFDELLEKKSENEKNQNLLIDQLNHQIEEKEKQTQELKTQQIDLKKPQKISDEKLNDIFEKIEEEGFSTSTFLELGNDIIANNKISQVFDPSDIAYYKLEGLIDKASDRTQAKLTNLGEEYYKYLKWKLKP
jgi:hypothetical protein